MSVDRIRGLLRAGLGTGANSGVDAGSGVGAGAGAGAGASERHPTQPTALARRSRWRVPIGATIVIVLAALVGAVAVSVFTPQGSSTIIGDDRSAAGGSVAGSHGSDGAGGSDGTDGSALGTHLGGDSGASPSGGIPLFVHILGAVRVPGLYQLREGDRAVDAVAAAGGFLADADLTQLNLARFVGDGEQIVVPVIGATPPAGGSGVAASGAVNINTADAATLETLPRVGPAMSARIIAWRDQNGRFAVIEDLMNVSGIGEKTFDGLKALIST